MSSVLFLSILNYALTCCLITVFLALALLFRAKRVEDSFSISPRSFSQAHTNRAFRLRLQAFCLLGISSSLIGIFVIASSLVRITMSALSTTLLITTVIGAIILICGILVSFNTASDLYTGPVIRNFHITSVKAKKYRGRYSTFYIYYLYIAEEKKPLTIDKYLLEEIENQLYRATDIPIEIHYFPHSRFVETLMFTETN
ncbi:hypothetical protein EJ419_03520 [Alloscardovia theropitheci]|uniref:Uncharacterized protein n=1 Tax=Alloscardovia theropitheci TaxID=2496842 RepID=A0A4V2MU00_9BIFI|nr:hypothetical protein [Alloscardovia theropitheci]TCD54449.1 hypothetical protein EJ419_03520 [Alloscardovia theropitheci]